MTSADAPREGNQYWYFNPEARRGKGEFRYNWRKILPQAAAIVRSYGDGAGVTLRQLFYRLVAAEMLPNTQQAYGSLSSKSAEARREGDFPRLMDRNRDIDRPNLWTSAADAGKWVADQYMEDRSATQGANIYIGVEKNALRGQLFQWFAPLGLPVIALGGYPSQTIVDEVWEDTKEGSRAGKSNILIYGGDFDADGEDIERDFIHRAGCFDETFRVALTPEQIEEFKLPPQPGKWSSARAQGFADKYSDLFERVYGLDLVQIELDALPPEDLRKIFQDEIDKHFDRKKWEEIVLHERREKIKLEDISDENDENEDDDEDLDFDHGLDDEDDE